MDWISVREFLNPNKGKIILTLLFIIFELNILLTGYKYLFCLEAQRPMRYIAPPDCYSTNYVRLFLDFKPLKGGMTFLTPSTFTSEIILASFSAYLSDWFSILTNQLYIQSFFVIIFGIIYYYPLSCLIYLVYIKMKDKIIYIRNLFFYK